MWLYKAVIHIVCLYRLATQSSVTVISGHYPPVLCKVTDAVFSAQEKTFYAVDTEEQKCSLNWAVWPVKSRKQDSKTDSSCDVTYKHGQAYTIYYYAGTSNYYHLTYDMMIPLYFQMHHTENIKHEDDEILFMPTVETRRLQELDWKTKAFNNMSRYWVDMAKLMADNSKFMPLDETFLQSHNRICFDEIYFGTASVDFSNSDIIRGFVKFVKKRLGIQDKKPSSHRLALVSRKGRRRILNEETLVKELQNVIPSDLVEFSGMSFADQVKLMQNYTVLAALNGAGLMNALYLPEQSVTIQMAPYQSGLNIRQYGMLLKSRGPYLEWHNTHKEMTVEIPGDRYNNMPNTIVHIEEFKDKVREAMTMYDQIVAKRKSEL